jgi:peptide/nickel transport system permease protein
MVWGMRRLLAATLSVSLLAVLAAAMTAVLMQLAPGFYTDEAELNPTYGGAVQIRLQDQQRNGPGALLRTAAILSGWAHLDFGRSRTWDVPVSEIVRSRALSSVRLLFRALCMSWLIASAAALVWSSRQRPLYEASVTLIAAGALATPAGVLATLCILTGRGGPVLVITALLSARIFRFLRGLLQEAWKAPHVVAARGFGLSSVRIFARGVWPQLLPQIPPLAGMSLMIALAALVPVEVLFDQAGLGKLAWQATTNRDLPVLLAVTLLFAGTILAAGTLLNSRLHVVQP